MVLASVNDLSVNNQVEELQKKRIKGEAHFLRALYYFTLGNLYGQPYCTNAKYSGHTDQIDGVRGGQGLYRQHGRGSIYPGS